MPWSYCGAWWGADDNCRTRTNFTEDPEVKAAAKLIRWRLDDKIAKDLNLKSFKLQKAENHRKIRQTQQLQTAAFELQKCL